MTKTGLEFVILVIVICLIFDICDLEFLCLLCSSTQILYQSTADSGMSVSIILLARR